MMDAPTPAPALMTSETLARIRELAPGNAVPVVAAILRWPVDRLQRVARAHGIELFSTSIAPATLIAPQPAVVAYPPSAPPATRAVTPTRGECRAVFTISLRDSENKALRRAAHANQLSMSEAVRRVMGYIDANKLWDTVLK